MQSQFTIMLPEQYSILIMNMILVQQQ